LDRVEREKVGVGSECNTTPSSDWLIPLSHFSTLEEVSMFAEDTAARVSRFTVVTCKVESTDVSPPTVDAGHNCVVPALIHIRRVCLPGADGALGDLLPTLLVPAVVTLLWETAPLFNIVVAVAGVAGAETASFSRVRGSIGRGEVGGCVHVVRRSSDGWLRELGQRFNWALWGRGVEAEGRVIVGIGGIEGVPKVSISITLKVRVTGFIIVGHGREGVFIG